MKVAIFILLALPLHADDFFEKKIRPTLMTNCFNCHSGSARTASGGLRLDPWMPGRQVAWLRRADGGWLACYYGLKLTI